MCPAPRSGKALAGNPDSILPSAAEATVVGLNDITAVIFRFECFSSMPFKSPSYLPTRYLLFARTFWQWLLFADLAPCISSPLCHPCTSLPAAPNSQLSSPPFFCPHAWLCQRVPGSCLPRSRPKCSFLLQVVLAHPLLCV